MSGILEIMEKLVEMVEEVELWEVEFCEGPIVSLPRDVELLIVEGI